MKQFKNFTNEALNQLQLNKVDYADIRIVKLNNKSIASKDGVIEALDQSFSYGFSIRVLVKNSWGFAAAPLENISLNLANKKLLVQTIKKALTLAKTSSYFNKQKIAFRQKKPITATYKTKVQKDPFKVNENTIISLLLKTDKALRIDKKIKISQAFFSCHKEEKLFASTEGSRIFQEIFYTGAGMEATAVEGQEVQNRSYPNSFRGQFFTKGYEAVENLDLLKYAPQVGKQAVRLLTAPNCLEGEYDIIIDGNQLALQVHESIGHPIEFDRILGYEASFAGTSFITPQDIGKLKYGSQVVNVTADATLRGGLGSFGFDDEGMPAKRQQIIKNGKLVGVLASRQNAQKYNLPITGAMRAESWNYIPLVRMTNINLEPGKWKLNDLISDTKKGLFLSTNKSWSIDDKRNNFQFGTEIARQIKNGKLGKIYKNPIYAGSTLPFWQSCDAVCNKKHWQIWGTPNCGKGEPVQTMYVGHGVAPSRFRKVKVFSGKGK